MNSVQATIDSLTGGGSLAIAPISLLKPKEVVALDNTARCIDNLERTYSE